MNFVIDNLIFLSSDVSDLHFVSVMLQFVDKNKVVRVEFYRLIQLHISSSGQAYLDAVEADFIKEGLWEYVRRKTVCLVTDSASNMISEDKGFVGLFKRKIGKRNMYTHRCLAHKLGQYLKFCSRKILMGIIQL